MCQSEWEKSHTKTKSARLCDYIERTGFIQAKERTRCSKSVNREG